MTVPLRLGPATRRLGADFAASPAATPILPGKPRGGARSIDKQLGRKIRERRILLGLSQQALAERIDVTNQQVHKYESGLNRITASRLVEVAAALSWSAAELLDGIERPQARDGRTSRQLQVARDFARLPDRKAADAIALLVRVLAGGPGGDE
jgi:transcriptional regulator with XRE-family HTH domain